MKNIVIIAIVGSICWGGSTAFSELLFKFEKPSASTANFQEPSVTPVLTQIAPPLNKVYTYRTQNRTPESIIDNLKRLFPEEKIIADPLHYSIYYYVAADKSKIISKAIEAMDVPAAQIKIEVEVIEISHSFLQSLGIKWEVLSRESLDGDQFLEYEKIELAKKKGFAKVKANPSLVVRDNAEAVINISEKVPIVIPDTEKDRYTIHYVQAGIKLKIKPRIISEKLIQTVIIPEVSSIKEWRPSVVGEYPVVSSKEAQTEMKVESGKTFFIAGLKSYTEMVNKSNVPLLSDIPVLGELFRQKRDEQGDVEIIFSFKPTLLKT